MYIYIYNAFITIPIYNSVDILELGNQSLKKLQWKLKIQAKKLRNIYHCKRFLVKWQNFLL